MEKSNNTPTPTPLLDETPKSSTTKLDPKTITSRYTVIDKLGQGGMGRVYSALDAKLNRTVAIKLLPYDNFNEEQWIRFQLEAKAASKLNHPNIVQILDFGQSETNEPYLVMEHVKGKNLSDYLKENGPIELTESVILISQLSEAMQHAHLKGIVHRDLKPANIILEEGKTRRGLILDFGIAKFATDNTDIKTLTQTGQIVGSPRCMSPEQARGEKIDHRADIYSMACILFECLSGKPVFAGDNALSTIEKHLNEAPPKLSDICEFEIPAKLELALDKALKKDPEERFQSIVSFKNAITPEKQSEQPTKSTEGSSGFNFTLDPELQNNSLFKKYGVLFLILIVGIFSVGYLAIRKGDKSAASPRTLSNKFSEQKIPHIDKWEINSPEKLIGSESRSYAGTKSEEIIKSESQRPKLSLADSKNKSSKTKTKRIKNIDNLIGKGEELLRMHSSYDSTSTCNATNYNTIETLKEEQKRVPNAKLLILTNVNFDNRVCEAVKLFPLLEKIKFENCHINYDAMKELLKIKSIVKLRFMKTDISKKISDAICNEEHVTELSLNKSNYSDETLLQFANSKSLKSINISNNKAITYKGLLKLLKIRKSKFKILYDQNNSLTDNQVLILQRLGLDMEREKATIDTNIQHMLIRD